MLNMNKAQNRIMLLFNDRNKFQYYLLNKLTKFQIIYIYKLEIHVGVGEIRG